MGFELAEQYDWQVPDVIVYPTGGGVGLIGIYKGLLELQAIGFPVDHLPRMVAVQAAGCAPIVRAFEAGPDASRSSGRIRRPPLSASTCRKRSAIFSCFDAVYATGGCAIAVDDNAIAEARRRVAAVEGMLLCPEGAATIAAAAALRDERLTRDGERGRAHDQHRQRHQDPCRADLAVVAGEHRSPICSSADLTNGRQDVF